ncbi:MAG: TonB family protein, partial [Bryobacteraceae bacterium]
AGMKTQIQDLWSESAGMQVTETPQRFPKRYLMAAGVSLALAAVVLGPRLVNRTQDSPDVQPQPPARATQAPESPPALRPLASVSAPGEVLERVLPQVPPKARNSIRGTVRVRVRLRAGPAGSVVHAALDSSGTSRYFADLALQAAKRWRFQAPKVDGRDVESEWLLRFAFTKTGTTVNPIRASANPSR